ncbi:DUF397 domain-containing protein [Kineosporia babensis]|uniref:DUF397 domain-containing protein n=1 Tax=Kineosporia babensis TaxID=499548 RepID=A0A9X1T0W7_9ACTN|nr:DUF397 domain-containing protein [Kineosporia babensis]MCD5313228.1 DUF397 domain-containing protein [Kineosporia babensis]
MEREKIWHKSTFSAEENCVEVLVEPERVLVRHTRDRLGPVLSFSTAEWQAFLQGVKADQFEVS